MILVTGASGLLGANLVLAARSDGVEVTAAYHHHPVHFPGVRVVEVDLGDPAALEGMVSGLRPDWVVHCAAATDVDWCEAHPAEAERVNAEASGALAEAAAAAGARFAYISTDAVFDGSRGGYDESDDPAPCNVYGRTKRDGERLVQRAQPSSLVVRTNLYGWNVQPKASLGEWILERLEAGETVPGFEDVVFTPTLADRLARDLLDLMAAGQKGMFHVAGSEALSKYEFARRVARAFGFEPDRVRPVPLRSSSLKAPRPLNTSLRTEKAAKALGRGMPTADEGVREFKADRDSGYVDRLRSCRGA